MKENIFWKRTTVLLLITNLAMLGFIFLLVQVGEDITLLVEDQRYLTQLVKDQAIFTEEDETQEVIIEEEIDEAYEEQTLYSEDYPLGTITNYVLEITKDYPNVEPELVLSVIFHESTFRPDAKNGNHLGLMQVSTRWHSDRAERLGVKDFYDPYGNILLGVDYISELTLRYKDPALVLMLYNMSHNTAHKLYKEGKISNYAKSVLALAEEYKKGE